MACRDFASTCNLFEYTSPTSDVSKDSPLRASLQPVILAHGYALIFSHAKPSDTRWVQWAGNAERLQCSMSRADTFRTERETHES